MTAFLHDCDQPGWEIVRRIPIMGPEEHGGHCELVDDGLEIPRIVRRPAGDTPVAPAATWLLTTGWRERGGGPIRRDEMPPTAARSL